MAYTVRPGKRSNAKPLIGLHAESGGGKTYSALLLARGYAGPQGKIVMIETEEGRGEAYSDPTEYPEIGGYEVISMGAAGFSPVEYGKAIDAAEKYKPDALIIDSASHEWEGRGGVLDQAAKNQADNKKGMLVWQKPKMDHNTHFMLRVLQTSIPLVILCMRSKYLMEQKEVDGKKDWVRSSDLTPKQSDDILYEMFLHGWFERETHNFRIGNTANKGLRQVFLDREPFTLDTGRRLKAWSENRAIDAPASTQTQGPKVTAIELLGPGGTAIDTYSAWGAWIDGFTQELQGMTDPDKAQAMWEANEATFDRGSKAAAKNPAATERFNALGKLALEKRMPPAETPDEPSGDQGSMEF